VISIFLRAGRDFTPDELPALHGPPPTPVPAAPVVPPAPAPAIPPPSAPATTSATVGEVAIAASDSANTVVYAANGAAGNGDNHGGQVMYSDNLGASINVASLNLTAITAAMNVVTAGDPSLAVGAPSAPNGQQRFYYSQIFGQILAPPITPTTQWGGLRVITFQSTDSTGKTFQQLSDNLPLNCAIAANG
jgi:hypothetical protein